MPGLLIGSDMEDNMICSHCGKPINIYTTMICLLDWSLCDDCIKLLYYYIERNSKLHKEA